MTFSDGADVPGGVTDKNEEVYLHFLRPPSPREYHAWPG